MKIAIGMPTYGTIRTNTVHSLLKMVKKLPCEYNLLTQTGSYIQSNREEIVKMAKKLDCTHLLFVDHDMIFESKAVEKLINHNKDIIGADYNLRKLPLESTIKRADPNGAEIWVEHPNGLVECCAVGMGFTLINLLVFDHIPHPWFFLEPDKDGSIKYGEDMWFCRKAREAGYKIWCDLTAKVQHMGDYTY